MSKFLPDVDKNLTVQEQAKIDAIYALKQKKRVDESLIGSTIQNAPSMIYFQYRSERTKELEEQDKETYIKAFNQEYRDSFYNYVHIRSEEE